MIPFAKIEEGFRPWAKRQIEDLIYQDLVIKGYDEKIVNMGVNKLKGLIEKGDQPSRNLLKLALARAASKFSPSSDLVYNFLEIDKFDIEVAGNPSKRFCKDHNYPSGRYETKKKLGRGTWGVVHLAYDKERNEDVALKTLEFLNIHDNIQKIKRELRVLRKLSYKKPCPPNISCLYDWYCIEDGAHFTVIISMEYVDGKGLYKHSIKTDAKADKIIKGLAAGVLDLQNVNVVHMDLHGGNVLINKTGQVKIIDFGWSCFEGYLCSVVQQDLAPWGGFEKTRPPELVDETIKSTIDAYKRTDIWMLGALIRDVIKKRPQELYQGLVEKMLNDEPIERPTIGEVVSSVAELQDFKQELVDLASSLNRKPWEVHQCAKLAALTHKITFRETMELLLP